MSGECRSPKSVQHWYVDSDEVSLLHREGPLSFGSPTMYWGFQLDVIFPALMRRKDWIVI